MNLDAPLIALSARKHGTRDHDMIHAFNHPILVDDLEEGLTMFVGADLAGNLLESRRHRQQRRPDRHSRHARPTEIPEVIPMPRTAQEILDHADALAARFERHQPGDDVRDASALAVVRAAFQERAEAERNLANAVVQARHAGHSWASIGPMVGTSGEAARQRYGQSVPAS